MTSSLRRLPLPGLGAIALAAGLLTACGDPFSLKASIATVTDTLTVYALSDTASVRRSLPTSLNTGALGTNANGETVGTPTVVPVSVTATFDVAFDLTSDRKVVLYPQRRILPGTSGHVVGLQAVAGQFESVLDAPRGGYAADTVALTVAVGQTVAVQAQTSECTIATASGYSPYVYSKIVVDSVSTSTPAIFFRVVVDPNCGFRSFRSGVPGR